MIFKVFPSFVLEVNKKQLPKNSFDETFHNGKNNDL